MLDAVVERKDIKAFIVNSLEFMSSNGTKSKAEGGG
jgi:hypothetical protein